MNGEQNHKWRNLIQRWIRNEDIKVEDIPLDLNEELLDLDANLEIFIMTPIVLYIIKQVMARGMSN